MSVHGFVEMEIVEGRHTTHCLDVLCDGCVPLDECSICKRPEFEHGDGDE
jgi:hypothetical protein